MNRVPKRAPLSARWRGAVVPRLAVGCAVASAVLGGIASRAGIADAADTDSFRPEYDSPGAALQLMAMAGAHLVLAVLWLVGGLLLAVRSEVGRLSLGWIAGIAAVFDVFVLLVSLRYGTQGFGILSGVCAGLAVSALVLVFAPSTRAWVRPVAGAALPQPRS